MRSHGSGEACGFEGRVPHCDECRAHKRDKDRQLRATPGTYKYNRDRGIGRAGSTRQLAKRRRYRRDINANDSRIVADIDAAIAERFGPETLELVKEGSTHGPEAQ